MAHGAPDYSNVQKQGILHRVDDLAELAARLGSVVNFDRQGEVLYADNFDGYLLKWATISLGSSTVPKLDGQRALSGDQSLYCTTDATLGLPTGIYRYISFTDVGKMGLECSWLTPLADCTLSIVLEVVTGAIDYFGNVLIGGVSGALQVQLADGSYLAILPSAQIVPTGLAAWNHAKLVIDMASRRYVRLALNSDVWDLSAHGVYVSAAGAGGYINAQITWQTPIGQSANVWTDNVIITQNEP